jgi:hypothetical protein
VLPSGVIKFKVAFCLINGDLKDTVVQAAQGLEHVFLCGNFNATVPAVLGNLPEFQCLYISDCFISGDLSYMQGMPKLFEHWIDVYGPGHPWKPSRVSMPLHLTDCFISGDLSYMQGMPKLFEHWIDVKPGLTGSVFPFFGSLSSFSVTASSLFRTLPTELGIFSTCSRCGFMIMISQG